ncbi:MAG: homoserine kinase [Candidatus Verstraetearchaeota archaeon]|nr:homoserine kinase [Candidatus Verstraetearchaeota archaeon]
MKVIEVSAPATIANLGPGYDLMGMALDSPRDHLRVCLAEGGKDEIEVEGIGGDSISAVPDLNAAMVAGRAVLRETGIRNRSLKMHLKKGVPPRMGMGSSGASSAAGAFAVNVLLGKPLNEMQVLKCAMEGERASCGAPHADNVAPSLLGGIILILNYDPLEVMRFKPVTGVEVVEVAPVVKLADNKTKKAREVLPSAVALATVVAQMSSFATLLMGVANGDPKTMGSGISGDRIVEPARAKLIPGFFEVKRAAIEGGAFGCSISGAGPSVFALSPAGKGTEIGERMKEAFMSAGVNSSFTIHKMSEEGAKVV